MTQNKIMVAMSGGVDSSVAVWLMLQQGYHCAGATMRMCDASLPNMAGAPDPAVDAQLVAQRLEIPFYVFDGTQDFRRQVIDPFVSVYENGGTPNPCIRCNHTIKFGILLEQALKLGCSHIVTAIMPKFVKMRLPDDIYY